ncbi:MAG: hypothetical protein DI538_14860 [Azospira oryzae]|jgi:hypothetical protein|nr:MAG: hypothetical protein DI538_14860 [Azospira oryzae]
MRTVSLSSFIKTSSYWSKRVGVRWQLLLSVVFLWLASMWLRNEYGQDDSNLWLVMNQFILLVQWTVILLFIFSLLTALITWAFFVQGVKNKRITLQAKFGDGKKAQAGWVPFSVLIQGNVLRPLLGTIQARLVFSGKRLSDRVILDVNVPRPRHWWRQAIRGNGQTLLHDRGIYDIEHVLISYEDMLGLVSLPCTIPFNQQLYTLPRVQEPQKITAQPNATEEQKYRIDISKRVEGEHVNYKEFETGDNIHRIVWKIYAKSGQLVVRIPETKDPYASHLYFYASFFDGLAAQEGAFETELLNVYKDHVRNLLEALQRNGYDVRMPYDQEVPRLADTGNKEGALYQISVASWQKQQPPAAFVNVNKAAFVCLPSLVQVNEIETILKNLPASVPLVVVKLSDAIPSPFQFTLKDIFFKKEQQPADPLRQPWLLSSLRRDLQKNEKEIAALLKQRDNSWLTRTIGFEK